LGSLAVHNGSRISIMSLEFSLVLGLVLDRSTTVWFRVDKVTRCVKSCLANSVVGLKRLTDLEEFRILAFWTVAIFDMRIV
jgi:hypothetical protein